jgi:hypothetical protein
VEDTSNAGKIFVENKDEKIFLRQAGLLRKILTL